MGAGKVEAVVAPHAPLGQVGVHRGIYREGALLHVKGGEHRLSHEVCERLFLQTLENVTDGGDTCVRVLGDRYQGRRRAWSG